MRKKKSGNDGLKTRSETTDGDAVTIKGLLDLAEQQNYRCALTGLELTPSEANADHVHSMMDGGANVMSNLQVVHEVVNRMKNTMSQQQFVEWCCRVADYSRRAS